MYKKRDFSRIRQLSQPKLRNEFEDLVGPGSYNPSDLYLSTKCKSPRPFMCKSSRFKFRKLPPISIIDRKPVDCEKECKDLHIRYSPGVSFERTGHNLKLVDNPEFPGVGQYSPMSAVRNKGHMFAKATRTFSWKKVPANY